MMWKNHDKYKNKFKTGDVFGKWTVIDGTPILRKEGKDHKRSHIKVKCTCGVEKFIPARLLTNSKGCFDCTRGKPGKDNPSWTGVGDLSGSRYGFLKRRAKAQGQKFNVTKEQLWKLYKKQNRKCALSGLPIEFDGKHGPNRTASLDRIDSTKGYTLDNVQWVHKDINIMKNAFDEKYFVKICKLISENR